MVPCRAVLVVALAGATPPAFELLAAAERGEIAESSVADEHDIATRPAVAAVRASLGHELLAAEAEPAVAPTPGLHFDAGPVLKHGATSRCSARRRPCGARRSTGTRPCRPAWRKSCRRDRCRRPGPGRKRVPRWRTRIIPAVTCWPSNIFTPRRCACESRPLREEPSPFLCAMSNSLSWPEPSWLPASSSS